MLKRFNFWVLVFLTIFTDTAFSQIRLPRLISDGMVLQRDAEVKIWGWAAPSEKVTMHFMDATFSTVTDSAGKWQILLNGLKAGGPYKMTFEASNTIEVKDVLVGDVWLCSGQSNMELPMRRVSWVYPHEIASSKNNFIRQFKVPQFYDFNNPRQDFAFGSWKPANPDNIMDFSAVAYFFAREIYNRYNVPVGLINNALGGSPAEAWMSEEALKEFPVHYQEMQRFKDTSLIVAITNSDRERSQKWYSKLYQMDEGVKDRNNPWSKTAIDTTDWKKITVPGYWSGTSLDKVNGVVWYRRVFHVSAPMASQPSLLLLGRIVDSDSVYINGKFVGTTGYQYPPRRYPLAPRVLREGENTIVVRVISNQGNGGFVPDKPYEIVSEAEKVDLKGEWLYKTGTTMEPLGDQTFVRWKPGGLYNAMISPLTKYSIKGVIWYQGESNASRPVEYAGLFPAMIKDWRKSWKKEFPFLFVQLANFMEPKVEPGESDWALLRESQLKTLSVPKTGMAVIIDLGEWNDIHPLHKKDVGYRLSLVADQLAYNNPKAVSSGPVYKSMVVNKNKIILSFASVGSGLVAKNGELKYFAIAGADRKFVWAKAKIEKDKVVVWSDVVSNPVAVRYAWADNPEGANLYNKEGLPASPFRTDDWSSAP